jgi:peptidyl-prolyl cis-trans isomerase D
MLTLIRNQSKVLMIILLALISLSFIVYFNLPAFQSLSRGNLGRIAGRSVTQDEFRLSRQASDLQLSLSGNTARGREVSEEVDRFAWTRLVLLSAAQEMKLAVSEQEIGDYIQGQFRGKDGKYDANSYASFLAFLKGGKGISEDRWEEIVRENLLIQKAHDAVVAAATAAPADIDRVLGLELGEAKLSLLRFNAASAAAGIAFTPADAEKEYNDNLESPVYRSPERRTVTYVPFLLSPAEEKLPAKDKDAAKRKLGEQAQAFAVAALDQAKDDAAFAALAARQGHASVTTAPFAVTEPPAGLPPSLSFNRAAFGLNADVPVSDAIETDHGYYVLKLAAVQASAPLPLAQVRPLVEKNLRQRLALRQARERGEAAAKDLHAALAAGKPFAAAAAELKVPVESLPAFVPQQASAAMPDAAVLVRLSVGLQPGQASDFVPTADGGLIAYLEKRAPAAAVQAAVLRAPLAAQMLAEQRQALFSDWLTAQDRRKGSSAPAFSRAAQE